MQIPHATEPSLLNTIIRGMRYYQSSQKEIFVEENPGVDSNNLDFLPSHRNLYLRLEKACIQITNFILNKYFNPYKMLRAQEKVGGCMF